MQAKAEPGNINTYQLSPTVQATRSNYLQLHGGKRTLYLEFFIDHSKTEVLIDQLQSEQGARFYRKRNRNIIIRIPDDYELKLNEEFSKQPNAYLGLRKEITPKKFTKFAINSFNNGAKFLKGCCNIMPDHIRALSNSI